GNAFRYSPGPGDLGVVQGHHRQAHLARALLQFAGMGEIDERIAGGVVDARDTQALPDQRAVLLEDLLAAAVEVDVAYGDRTAGAAIDRRIRRILEPVALLQPVDQRAVEVGDVADDALHLGIRDGLDGDVVAGPVHPDA